MTETPQEAQAGVADALRDLSDNSRALVRHEIAAAQQEMWDKAKQAMPAVALLGAAAFFGILTAAASFRLSNRLLEHVLPPATAALTATAVYGAAAGTAGALGVRRLQTTEPLFPARTAREAVKTAADTARSAGE